MSAIPVSFPEDECVTLPCGNIKREFGIYIEANTPTEEELEQYRWIVSNWDKAWSVAEAHFHEMIEAYNFETPLEDLLLNEDNHWDIDLVGRVGTIGQETNWSIILSILYDTGQIQFSCEFKDFEVTHYQPSF